MSVQAVYLLTQQLATVEQQTHEEPQVTESSNQPGLILVSSSFRGERWNRELEEYILPQEALDSARNNERAAREALRQSSDELMAERKVALNLSDPLEIESNATNGDVAIPCRVSMVPYNVPSDPLPLPLFSLYWPTVTPLLPPAKRMEPGAQWKGELQLQIGAGVFPVAYSTRLIESAEEDYTVEIKLEDRRPSAQAGSISLTLHPQGQWTAKIARATNLWKSARGQIVFSVRAKFIEDDEPIEVDVLKCQNIFSLEALPVTFDHDRIYTSAWKYHADHPQLRPVQPAPAPQPAAPEAPPLLPESKREPKTKLSDTTKPR